MSTHVDPNRSAPPRAPFCEDVELAGHMARDVHAEIAHGLRRDRIDRHTERPRPGGGHDSVVARSAQIAEQ